MYFFTKIKCLATAAFLLLAGLASPALWAQTAPRTGVLEALSRPNAWADSVLSKMTLDQKIGQLMMVAVFSDQRADPTAVSELIERYHVGGLIFFQGDPITQASLTNRYQQLAKVPLMVAIDGEWGLGMRLENTMSFPYQIALGAVQNDSLIYQMGQEIAKQFLRVGIQVNFAPVLDVNNNPANPVINYRSFGENRELVARKGIAYMKGMQDGGLLATAKHFPGHGDTGTDSHYDLPLIPHDRARLDQLELYPFREAIKAGMGSFMIAHLSIPALDNTPNLPSTLSKPIVTGLLREELGYNGLVFSDAMNMQGLKKYFDDGKAEVLALASGMDMLEYVDKVPLAIEKVKEAIAQGQLTEADINAKCLRVLKTKAWMGLQQKPTVALPGLVQDLNRPEAKALARQLHAESLTLLANQQNTLPIKRLGQKIAVLSIGKEQPTAFQQMAAKYAEVTLLNLPSRATPQQMEAAKQQLQGFDLILCGLHFNGLRPNNRMEYTTPVTGLIDELSQNGKTIFAAFFNPYLLENFAHIHQAQGLLVGYQDNPDVEELAAQALFGAIPTPGRLPVSVGTRFPFGAGQTLPGGLRLGYALPEEVGMEGTALRHRIDSLARLALAEKAAPGMQVLVAKAGKVIFHQAYGYHQFDNRTPVSTEDLYDFASITKITGPLPALMQLHTAGKLDLNAPVATYFKGFKGKDKRSITMREVLAHTGRVTPFISFWPQALDENKQWKPKTFQTAYSAQYPVKITDQLYLHKAYAKKMFKAIGKSDLREKREYVYSDLPSIIYPKIIEKLTGETFENYVQSHFYRPIGAHTLGYNPLTRYPASRIVPTEMDTMFRKQLVQGTVHDEAAAMLGGVSGHAGLFGTANDLAKMMQLYMNMGEYGGERYIGEATLREFTRCQYPQEGNRRGLGFDKPLLQNPEKGFPAPSASPNSFGHSGFTGTFTWADPDNQLLLVIMTNRIHPTRENRKMYTLDIYQKIHQTLYELVQSSEY